MAKKQRTCIICGKTFEGTYSGQRGNLVCSEECRREAISRSKRKGRYVECELCRKRVWRRPYRLKKNRRHFCSSECYYEWKSRKHTALVCDHCGKQYTVPICREGGSRYCSARCKQLNERDRVTLQCILCDSEFEVIRSRADTARLCSKECATRYFLQIAAQHRVQFPTSLEEAVDRVAPPEVQYTGDGQFMVNCGGGSVKCPDFIVTPIKDTKKLIEVFGEYWHPAEDEPNLVELYQHAGYQCLVIWESEISDGSFHDKLLKFLQR